MNGQESHIFITTSMFISMRQAIVQHFLWRIRFWKGAPAVERYKKFLSGGCSMAPVELLKIAGVNLETPAPIQDALNAFGEIIKEMETLVED